MSYSDLLRADWSRLPGDIIDSIAPYLSAQQVRDLCLRNDTFNRRVCQNENSVVWKLLYQRDISENIPRDHIASRYLDIMDYILTLDPDQRLLYGASRGYDEIVKSALQDGANINASYDRSLQLAALTGHTETVKLLLDRGAKIHVYNDEALRDAAENGNTDTVKLLLDRGAKIHASDDYSLHVAASNGHSETVKLLLKHGATITPIIRNVAELTKNPEIIALLK